MFLSALLAGSIVPFSSEMVLAGLQLAGVSNISLLLWGTAGNVCGGMINYGLGRLGKIEWLEKHAHIANIPSTVLFMAVGKAARYAVMLFVLTGIE